MEHRFGEIPWGDLWRWVVTTMLFVLGIGMPPAYFTEVDTEFGSVFVGAVVLTSALIAAYVVWSDTVPWPGG